MPDWSPRRSPTAPLAGNRVGWSWRGIRMAEWQCDDARSSLPRHDRNSRSRGGRRQLTYSIAPCVRHPDGERLPDRRALSAAWMAVHLRDRIWRCPQSGSPLATLGDVRRSCDVRVERRARRVLWARPWRVASRTTSNPRGDCPACRTVAARCTATCAGKHDSCHSWSRIRSAAARAGACAPRGFCWAVLVARDCAGYCSLAPSAIQRPSSARSSGVICVLLRNGMVLLSMARSRIRGTISLI